MPIAPRVPLGRLPLIGLVAAAVIVFRTAGIGGLFLYAAFAAVLVLRHRLAARLTPVPPRLRVGAVVVAAHLLLALVVLIPHGNPDATKTLTALKKTVNAEPWNAQAQAWLGYREFAGTNTSDWSALSAAARLNPSQYNLDRLCWADTSERFDTSPCMTAVYLYPRDAAARQYLATGMIQHIGVQNPQFTPAAVFAAQEAVNLNPGDANAKTVLSLAKQAESRAFGGYTWGGPGQ